jgi:hypothetical protein
MRKPRAKASAAPPRLIEYRKIVVAAGIQFQKSVLPDVAKRVPGMVVDTTGDSAVYFSRAQGVGFNISYARTKSTLKAALETPGIHVMTDSHSRYGRGCCFGDTLDQDGNHMVPGPDLDDTAVPLPGDDWEDGATADSGIFRMAYRYVPIPVSDIVHHGYAFHPVPASVTLDPAQCHPDLVAGMKSLKALPLTDPLIAAAEKKAVQKAKEEREDPAYSSHVMDAYIWKNGGHTLPQKSLLEQAANLDGSHPVGQQYWYFGGRNSAEGASVPQLVLYAGWQDTLATPMELDKANIQCRVLTLLGCSTLLHFKNVLRAQKNWQQADDNNIAYFTTNTSTACSDLLIAALLTYNKYNAGLPWGPSLAAAVQNRGFQIIKG